MSVQENEVLVKITSAGTISIRITSYNVCYTKLLRYFHPGGIRLGVSEITRIGMKQKEMKEIASFIKMIVIDKKDPKKIV